MKKMYFILLVIVFAGIVASCKKQEQEQVKEKEIDKVAVQTAMDSFIQEKLSTQEGTYDIKGVNAKFDYLHDGVKESDGLFVSCADFKAGEDVYDIDYYVRTENEKSSVVKVMFHKKNGEIVDEVLWQQ